MRIAISGAHGQGKTTIVNSLKTLQKFKDYSFFESPTRALQSSHQINENGTQDTQVSIMFKHYQNVANAGNDAIFDRCALDGIVYTSFFKDKLDSTVYDSLYSLYTYTIKQYDILFYIWPELALTDDGTRSQNYFFFEKIKDIFDEIINTCSVKFTTLKGNNNQRIETILQTLNNYETR